MGEPPFARLVLFMIVLSHLGVIAVGGYLSVIVPQHQSIQPPLNSGSGSACMDECYRVYVADVPSYLRPVSYARFTSCKAECQNP